MRLAPLVACDFAVSRGDRSFARWANLVFGQSLQAGMPDSWPPDFPLLQASSDPRSCFHKPSIAIDQGPFPPLTPTPPGLWLPPISAPREFLRSICRLRSEERRVGKECRSRGSPDH